MAMHVAFRFSARSAHLASVVAVAAMAVVGSARAAQDGDEPHPAHIHSGTCAELGDVVIPLADVALPEGDAVGPASALAVKVSENTVDMPLQEIIDGGHAINIHLSAEEIGTYIACGDIGGVLHQREDGSGAELTIGLGELNDSGHSGVVWLGEAGDQTHVTIELVEAAAAEAGEAAPEEASPAAAAAAEATAVEIKGFAFNPPSITIPAGGSVTWTNQDNAPHTATGIDREALQSGALAFGESYTQTFDTAGSYDYFCEFHANMKGTVVVE
jgi:plastocyanin